MTAKKTKPTPKLSVMKRWIKRLEVPSAPTEDSKVQSFLERTLALRHPDVDILECSECGFEAPDIEEISSCPGCGIEFMEVEEEEAPEDKEASEVEEEAPEGKEASEVEEEAPEDKVIPLNKAKDQCREEDRATKRVNVQQAEKKAKDALKKIESKIDRLVAEAGRIEWDLGKELHEVKTRDLWLAAGAKSFSDYVRTRFPFTPATAENYMRIASTFSREQAQKIPLSYLQLISKAPEGDRSQLVDKVEKGEVDSARDLASDVKVLREQAGLVTTRGGMEDTVMVTQRLKPGPVAEGKWKNSKAGKRAHFTIGGQEFILQDHGKGWELTLQKPKG